MIGSRLKEVREARGYTQQVLADMIHVGLQQMWRWESGKTDPASDFVVRLSKALGVSADYLLGLTGDPVPNVDADELDEKERQALAAWRRGDREEAARVILNDKATMGR